MTSALEIFRAQKEAVNAVHVSLIDVGHTLRDLKAQVDTLTRDAALRELLKEQRDWNRQAQGVIADVGRLREQELRRYWPGVWRRWVLALVFALLAATAAGAGYAWVARPLIGDMAARIEFADALAQRILTMTPAERRQFDALMKTKRVPVP